MVGEIGEVDGETLPSRHRVEWFGLGGPTFCAVAYRFAGACARFCLLSFFFFHMSVGNDIALRRRDVWRSWSRAQCGAVAATARGYEPGDDLMEKSTLGRENMSR
jgi:hypothetical protein